MSVATCCGLTTKTLIVYRVVNKYIFPQYERRTVFREAEGCEVVDYCRPKGEVHSIRGDVLLVCLNMSFI